MRSWKVKGTGHIASDGQTIVEAESFREEGSFTVFRDDNAKKVAAFKTAEVHRVELRPPQPRVGDGEAAEVLALVDGERQHEVGHVLEVEPMQAFGMLLLEEPGELPGQGEVRPIHSDTNDPPAEQAEQPGNPGCSARSFSSR